MARSSTTFNSHNNPRKRKVADPLDRPAGASAVEIDEAIADSTPVPTTRDIVGEMAERLKYAEEASAPFPQVDEADVPETVAEAEAALREVQHNVVERQKEIEEEQRRMQAALRLANQAIERARAKEQERLRVERAKQVAAEAKALDQQRVDKRIAEEAAAKERHEAFVAQWRKKMKPVLDEHARVIEFQEKYEGALLTIVKRTYSKCSTRYPHGLRLRFDGTAEGAGRLLKQMQDSLASLASTRAKAVALVRRGVEPRVVNDVAEPGYHEFRTDVAELEQLIVYARDHHVDLYRQITNLLDAWARNIEEAKQYEGGPEQPQPSVRQDDALSPGMIHASLAKEHPDQNKTVRDGAHAPERPYQQQFAEKRPLP